jgi:ribonuclease P protein component
VGTAVDRNRARRRLREAYRRHQDTLPVGVEVVFIGRPAALTVAFTQLCAEIRQCLTALAEMAGQPTAAARRQ